jgi:hypothetical protein
MYTRRFAKYPSSLSCLVLFLLILNLASCGGSSDTSVNHSNNGYWKGEITDNFANTKDVFALFYEDEIMLADEFDKGIITGKVAINGSQFSSNKAKLFDDDGFNPRNIMIDGVIETRATIRATITDDIGEKHILSLNYERLSEEPVGYSKLSGSWNSSSFGDNYTANIDEKGNFYLEMNGCNFSGKLTIPNNSQIIFLIENKVSCGNSSSLAVYRGLGLYKNNTIIGIQSDDSYAETGYMQKI